MWNNSFRDGKAWMENFGWLTTKGVLVLPITKNSRVDNSDYTALPTKIVNGKSYVQYNDSWLGIIGMVHTHPGDPHSGLSAGDIATSGIFGVPNFVIGINRVSVGLGPVGNPNYYNSVITDTQYLLNGSISIYNDLIPTLPK